MNKVIAADGNYPSCIFTELPHLPAAYRSRTVPVETLIEMSRLESTLRTNDDAFQTLFRLAHSAESKDFDYLSQCLHEKRRALLARVDPSAVAEFVDINAQCGSRRSSTSLLPAESAAPFVIETIHWEVLVSFGYHPLRDLHAMYELQTAAMQYPDERAFQESVQFRCNRAGSNELLVVPGTKGPDCQLFPFDDVHRNRIGLHAMVESQARACYAGQLQDEFRHHPVVVVSGSFT